MLEALKPWAQQHSQEALLKLLPSLRLAWIPAKQLSVAVSELMNDLASHDTVQGLVAEAFDSQLNNRKRVREDASAPDQFVCSITQEVSAGCVEGL